MARRRCRSARRCAASSSRSATVRGGWHRAVWAGVDPKAAQQFHLYSRSFSLDDAGKEPIRLGNWQTGQPGRDRAGLVGDRFDRMACLGRGREQVLVHSEEFGQRSLCCGESGQAWWNGSFEVGVAVDLIAFPGAVGVTRGVPRNPGAAVLVP
jgi:hypothetical protein